MNEFRKIIGQHKAVAHLQNALHSGEISHAYILSGESGSGRMAMAEAMGAALLCQHPVERDGLIEPCGTCPACIRTAAGTHADLQVYTQERLAAQDRTKNTIGIKLIRLLVQDVQIKPYEGGRKVYIVPDAERLTTEAQNALLKTLEEPPAYAVLILLANGTSNFLPTILSRCVTLRLDALSRQELTDYLTQECGIPQAQAALAAGLSNGNAGMARQMAESADYQALYEETMDLYEHLAGRTAYDLAAFAQRVAEMGPIGESDPVIRPVQAVLSLSQDLVHDLLVCKSTGNAGFLILEDRIPYSRNIAQRLSFESLQRMQDEVLLAQQRLLSGTKADQVIEVMLLNMREQMKVSH